jgi:site-specific DNA-cytosine methylase
MRFGSVCSGIEAASVAWHPLGWKAAWLSEIEPFPSAVLAHHYPDVPNLGDMTLLPERILSGEVEAPDVFCGGTPCQAFSVAGLRNSLDDARGNLSLTFVGIANAIDHVRSVRGEPASIVFWENVPGVLSTKDNAFGCFLAGLAGENNPLEPTGGKWTNAGYVLGPKRAVAWRVLDAQYFGVAQRRKRVFVVASARADFDPAAVLFEFDGVRRDTAPSRETGQAIAPCVTNGPPFSRTGNERVEAEAMVVSRSHWDGDYPHPTLNQSAKGSGGVGSSNQEIFSQRGAYLAPVKRWPADIASTLDTTFGTKQGLEDQHVNAGCPLFVPDCAPTLRVNRPGEGGMPGDAGQLIPVVANTLNCLQGIQAPDTFNYVVHGTQDPCVSDIAFAQGRNNGGENVLAYTTKMHNTTSNQAGKFYEEYSTSLDTNSPPPAVFQPIALQDVTPREKAQNGRGWNDDGTAYTVDTHATQGVAQPIAFSHYRTNASPGEMCPTLQVSKGGGTAGAAVAQPITFSSVQSNQGINADLNVSQTLEAKNPMAFDAYNQTQSDTTAALRCAAGGVYDNTVAQPVTYAETAQTLTAGYEFDYNDEKKAASHIVGMQVRRLTPVECERLQGFPDNYTNIPWRKKDESPDGPRYKALGNSWAVPNVRWIGKRIQENLK